jgi:hypothetical protein
MVRKRAAYVRRKEAKPRDISRTVAHERALNAALARTTPHYHFRKLAEAAPTLTEAQMRRFAALVLLFAAGDTPSGDETA